MKKAVPAPVDDTEERVHVPPTVTEQEDKTLSVLIYGPTGGGKTFFSSSASQAKDLTPVIMINTDQSTGVIPKTWKLTKRRVRDVDELRSALKEVLSGKYKTVITDTGTELYHNVYLKEAMRVALLKRGEAHDPDIPEQKDYMRAHSKFLEYLRLIKDAGLNHIMTVQETYVYDQFDRDVLVGVGPDVSGKLNQKIGQFFAIIGRIQVNKEGIFEFHCKPEFRLITKDRLNLIPGVLELDNMAEAMPSVYEFYKPRLGGK